MCYHIPSDINVKRCPIILHLLLLRCLHHAFTIYPRFAFSFEIVESAIPIDGNGIHITQARFSMHNDSRGQPEQTDRKQNNQRLTHSSYSPE